MCIQRQAVKVCLCGAPVLGCSARNEGEADARPRGSRGTGSGSPRVGCAVGQGETERGPRGVRLRELCDAQTEARSDTTFRREAELVYARAHPRVPDIDRIVEHVARESF